jgi:hypothetical protein
LISLTHLGVAGLMVTQTASLFTLGRKQADVNG